MEYKNQYSWWRQQEDPKRKSPDLAYMVMPNAKLAPYLLDSSDPDTVRPITEDDVGVLEFGYNSANAGGYTKDIAFILDPDAYSMRQRPGTYIGTTLYGEPSYRKDFLFGLKCEMKDYTIESGIDRAIELQCNLRFIDLQFTDNIYSYAKQPLSYTPIYNAGSGYPVWYRGLSMHSSYVDDDQDGKRMTESHSIVDAFFQDTKGDITGYASKIMVCGASWSIYNRLPYFGFLATARDSYGAMDSGANPAAVNVKYTYNGFIWECE
jgi:hypothetical protein